MVTVYCKLKKAKMQIHIAAFIYFLKYRITIKSASECAATTYSFNPSIPMN